MFPSRIFLVDDHALFRSGLGALLRARIENVEIIEAGSLEEVMRYEGDAPAAVLLDIQLQGLNGLDGIALIQRKWPRTPVVIISASNTSETARLALERGAVAFVSKSDNSDNILAVVENALSGVAHQAGHGGAHGSGGRHGHAQLTPRQLEVLDLLSQGLPNKTIGRRLGLSENTVRGHVQAVLAVLKVASRSEAVFAARRNGIIG